jgi:hypothetical protein
MRLKKYFGIYRRGAMIIATIGIVGLLSLAGGLSAQNAPSFSVRNSETFTG